MCGIAGIVGTTTPELLEAMGETLAHRGPDGDGTLRDELCGFAHRRLAIIDLQGGAQPMTTPDGRLWVTYNGEIYNFVEVRRRLEDEGYSFRTRCDTEVLLAGYLRWGDDLVDHLNGMFAFAIWDTKRKRLFAARDRVGIKPFYYAHVDGELAFASEPKALLRWPKVGREIDYVALDAYLDLFYVPPPLSMFRDLCQLPPGHTLVFEDGALDVRCYWDAEPVAEDIRDAEAWAEIVEPVLRSAVVMRTLSDVPLGAFLSGGIDSSIIVALLAEHASGPIDTFCVGYGEEGRSYDEREGARQVADHFGTRHHELALDSSLLHDIEAVVTGFDEPFGSPTALLSRALSAFTRQHVTVALAGDGGDELFGGYPRYRGMLLSDRASWLPRTAFEWSRRAVEGPESAVARSYRRWARQFLARAQDLPDDRYATWVGYADPSERDRLLGARARDRLRQSGRSRPVQTLFNAPRQADNVQRATYADLHGFLPENVLRCSDRMSMANALELRVPFCDHRLVEIAMQLPTPMRVTELATKRLLRRVARHRIALPPQVLRRRKLGFNAPLGVWLQRDMDRLTNDWLAPDSIAARGLLEPTEVARLIAEHHSGHRDHSVRLWALIVLEQWCRQYSPAL